MTYKSVSTGEIEHLLRCYVDDLRRETQASPTVRDSMRKIISILDEVLRNRRNKKKAAERRNGRRDG